MEGANVEAASPEGVNREPAKILTPVLHRRWLVAGFVLVCVLTYLPVVNLPYLFMDENWITRTDDYDPEGNRSLTKMIAVTQGRPVMAVWCKLTRVAAQRFGGLEVMRVLRLASILCLGLFGYLLFTWFRKFDHGTGLSIVGAAVVISLPAYQILIAAGVWIMPGLLAAAGAIPLAYYFLDREKPRWFHYLFGLVAPFLLLLTALANYQQIFLVVLPFLLVPALRLRWDQEAEPRFRVLALCALTVLAAVVCYYYVWTYVYIQYNPIPGEDRYNPMATVDLERFYHHKFPLLFLMMRLPEALNLWEPYFVPTLTYYVLIYITAVGLAFHILLSLRSYKFFVVLDVLFKVIAVFATMVLADIFVLSSEQDIGSYTTLSALSLTVIVVTCWSLSRIYEGLKFLLALRPVAALGWVGVAAALVFTVQTGNKRITYHFALPLHQEFTSIRSELEKHVQRHGRLNKIVINQRDKNFYGNGYWEFAWTNLNHQFYIYWFTRNILDHAALPSDVTIYARFADGREVLANPPGTRIGTDPDAPILNIDLSHVKVK